MATKKTFDNFCRDAASAIESGQASSAVILAEASAYGPFDEWVMKNPDTITRAAASGEDETLALLRGLFQNPSVFVVSESPLPQIEAQARQALSSLPVAEVSLQRKKSVVGFLENFRTKNKERVERTREIVRRFNKQVREQRLKGLPESGKQATDEDLNKSMHAGSLSDVKKQIIEMAAESSSDPRAARVAATEMLQEHPSVVSDVWRGGDVAGTAAILGNPEVAPAPEFYSAYTGRAPPVDAVDRPMIERVSRLAKISSVINESQINPRGVDYSGVRLSDLAAGPASHAVGAIEAVSPNVRDGAIQRAFANAWNKTVNAEGFVDHVTGLFGSEVVNSPAFQRVLRSGGDAAGQSRGLSGLARLAGDLIEPVRGPPSAEMVLYIQALYAQQAQAGEAKADPHHYVALRIPDWIRWNFSDKSQGWILRLLGKDAAAGAAGASVRAGFAATRKAITSRVVGFLVARGAPAWVASLVGGPVGWIVSVALLVLPLIKSAVSKIVNVFASGGIFTHATRAMSQYANDVLHTNYRDTTADRPMVLFALFLACVPLLLVGVSRFNRRVKMVQIVAPAGSGGEFTGPVEYTGPSPSGPLRCLNFNVLPATFNEVHAGPLTPNQGETINNAVNAYPQLGLYNCLLNCPQNKINVYGDGDSEWWGFAAPARSVVIYNGFFASGSVHLQARLIAHELAHYLGQETAFIEGTASRPRGYCGPLGTYPDGHETQGETFAEAAAMFITGENLQALCMPAYNFMYEMFRRCASP